MSDQAANNLEERSLTVAMMLLTYSGLYLSDKEECMAIMAEDDVLAQLVPSDVQLGFMIVLDLFASAADLDADDVRVICSAILAQSADTPS